MNDENFMKRAIFLAEQARRTAPPNPWVGCVIVQDGQIVGEGSTQPPGSFHAEVVALKQAAEKSSGATAYVTLEPCSHYGRTPPCVTALIESGVKRVFVGMPDPDTQVHGNGIRRLQEAGLEVHVGLCEDQVREQLNPYIKHRMTGVPYCIGKAAVSLDGRIAAADGSSQWISSQEARRDAHTIRADSQAILIGSGTALRDNPSLTARDVTPLPERQPLRVILDSSGKVQPLSPLFDLALAPTLIFTSEMCESAIKDAWMKAGANVEVVATNAEGGLDLGECLRSLGRKGVLQVLIEGGSTILSSFVKGGHLDELILYVGPILLGDSGLPLLRGITVANIEQAIRLELSAAQILGNTLKITTAVPTKIE